MKTLVIASLLSSVATIALAQDKPPKVPTGYEVKGKTCYVQWPNNMSRQADCLDDILIIHDSLNNRATHNRQLWQGSGDSGGGGSGGSK